MADLQQKNLVLQVTPFTSLPLNKLTLANHQLYDVHQVCQRYFLVSTIPLTRLQLCFKHIFFSE